MFEFRLKFHWSLFLRVQSTICQHWFKYWLGADQATSHYLNQWWLHYRRIYASLGLNELTMTHVLQDILAILSTQRTGDTSLDQVMACRLFRPKPMQSYCPSDPKEQNSVKFESKYLIFSRRKCTRKCHLQNVGHFVHPFCLPFCWGSLSQYHILWFKFLLSDIWHYLILASHPGVIAPSQKQ